LGEVHRAACRPCRRRGQGEEKDAKRWKADTTSNPQQRVNVILRKLGEPLYRSFLRDTFGPRNGPDGRRYTATHAALLRLPFRAYVTTNYDPALEFARAELRPESLSTGTPTWEDDDEVYRWRTGDVFADDCPMLWIHGYWQRPAGIVLNSGEYSQAYKPGIYRDTFQELWVRERLAFLGFGFNDPQFTFMVGEFLRDLGDANAVPRHVAILGLPVDKDGRLPDAEAIREWRENLEADYHVRALFYPVPDGDHSALQVLLEHLAERCGIVGLAAPPLAPPATPASVLPAKWIHETSNDEKFTGRNDEIARLDRWVRDTAVRVLGVCAVGGTGKTALIGHWLKETAGWRSRPFAGLFAWSFYQERDTKEFLEAFLAWARETFRTPEPNADKKRVAAALAALRAHPLVLVLDGLEVLQEGPDDTSYGSFLDGDLRELLAALCQRDHRSLAVLTSRFVFADLDRFLGTAFHQLELHGLAPDNGARLLEELGVHGPPAEREHVSEQLDGHPLGLRVFADALPEEDRDQPRQFLDESFHVGALPEGASLNDKLRRLLVFYEKKLPVAQVRILGIVSLFRAPIADETVVRLVRGVFCEALPDDATLTTDLRRLQSRGILTREPIEGGQGSACHPILRDHFRAVLLGTGADTARRSADLLTGQRSEGRPQNVKEIEPVLLAIELLLDAGDFKAANALYKQRLRYGEVFQWIPALAEGLRCALAFVRDEKRREQCKQQLSPRAMSFYLNDVGLFATYSGHQELALRYYGEANDIYRGVQDALNLSIGLQNEATLLVSLGRLSEAQRAASEALRLATEEGDEEAIRYSHSRRGWTASLSGQLGPAALDFALANALEKKMFGEELCSGRGVWWAELLLRSGHPALTTRRTKANLRICERKQWNEVIACCHSMLGWCALAEGRLGDAEVELRQAEPVLRQGQILFWLARLHVTAGDLALARQDAPGALDRAAEALALAAPRGMRLVHADALVLRGRARLLEVQADSPARALDDAEEALRLARDCGYAWAERDALFLEAETRAAFSARHDSDNASAATREREASRRARADAEALAARLLLSEEDLTAADAKALEWLKDWAKNAKK